MASVVTGIDVGTRAVRVVQGRRKGTAFVATRYVVRPRGEGESGADALTACLSENRIRGARARLGLTGRDTILRYSQVPRLTDSQLRSLMRFEIDELAQQAGGNLASDFNLLPIPPGVSGDDTVLVALAHNEALESTTAALKGTGTSIGAFTPNAVALYDAFLKLGSIGEDGVLIANIGNENTDVAIVLGPDLAFARNLSGGGKLFTDAICQRFGVATDQAEEMKRNLANLSPGAKGRYGSAQEEKVTNAMLGPAGQFASLLQSTATLAKAQLKLPELKIHRALLCGGGSRLLGLGEHLAATTGWQVQLFDPLEGLDLGSLPTEERAELERDRFEAVVALGLALASAETGLYKLDILPAAIVRKRHFAERTAFVIAAGVLAAGYLGAQAYVTKGLADTARITANETSRDVKQRQSIHDKTVEIVGDPNNGIVGRDNELAEIATELEVRAAAGATLLAVDRALRNSMPADLWITKQTMKIDRDQTPGLGAREVARPILHITGRGREGAMQIEEAFRTFMARLTETLGVAPVVGQAKSSSKGFDFQIHLNLVPVAAPAASAEGGK